MNSVNLLSDRRHFLRIMAASALTSATVAPTLSFASETPPDTQTETKTASDKIIRLFNTHTLEELHVTFWSDGDYVKSSLGKLDILLRDHREHEAVVMDPKLFDQLHTLQNNVGSDKVFEVVSAYRSKKTNNMLREKSSGVASNSYHIQGRAMDIRLRGTKTSSLRDAAIELQAGGVGYYAASDFIHIDTGPVRAWR